MAQAIEKGGASDLAKRALETTGQIFRHAIANGYAKSNPAKDFKPSDILKSSHKTSPARIDAQHLPDLLRKIEVYPGTHITRLAMKLIAHTFVKTTELIGAEWSEFDLRGARWSIPAERMKMRTPHIVPPIIAGHRHSCEPAPTDCGGGCTVTRFALLPWPNQSACIRGIMAVSHAGAPFLERSAARLSCRTLAR